MTKAGITWDTSLIQLRAGDGAEHGSADPNPGGSDPLQQLPDAPWAVYAVADVPEGRVLATIPRYAVLSAPNSGLADVLAAERLGGGLALVAAVMYEAVRGPKSKWYGYLSSLPPREYLPVFWSEEQLRQLEGTDIADKARTDRAAMAADFESELAPLLGRYPARLGPLEHGWNLQAFMRAASWVASRAFYVDEHHGDALVPLADVFNHKAARVDLRGRSGGWAEGFEVAEHADARRRQQRGGGGGGEDDSHERRRGQTEEDADGEDEDGEEDGGEGDESSTSDEDEGSSGEVTSSDGDEDEDDDAEESEGGSDGGSSDASEGGDGGRRRRGRGGKAGHHNGKATQLDVDAGDDGSDPWPPPPPPSPPAVDTQADAAAAGGDTHRGAPHGGEVRGGGAGAGGAFAGRWGLLAEEAVARGGRNLHLDIGICAGERGGCELLDIVAAQPLAVGAEVFNTYGEHGNDELVNKYGFALPYNPFDEVSLDKGAVLAAAEAEVGRKAAQKRARFLERHSELLAEDEEPFLLLPPRHVNTALYVALRVLAADAAQMAGWASLEDALAPLRAAWKRERQQRHEHQQQQQQQQAQQAAPEPRKPEAAAKGAEPGGDSAPEKAGKRRRGAGPGADAAGGGDGGGEFTAAGRRPEKRAKGGEGAVAPGGPAARVRHERDPELVTESDSGSSGAEESDGEDDDDLPEDVEIPGLGTGSDSGSMPDSKLVPRKKGSRPEKGSAATATGAAGTTAAAKSKLKPPRKGAAGGPDAGGSGAAADGDAAVAAAAEPLWTEAMRSLLRRVVSARLSAYPTNLEQDEQELRNPAAAAAAEAVEGVKQNLGSGSGPGDRGKDERDRKQDMKKKKGKSAAGKSGGSEGASGGGTAGGTSAEAAAARSCALLLRLGEKRLLSQALEHLS